MKLFHFTLQIGREMYRFHLLFMVINANAVQYLIIAFQYLFIQQKLEVMLITVHLLTVDFISISSFLTHVLHCLSCNNVNKNNLTVNKTFRAYNNNNFFFFFFGGGGRKGVPTHSSFYGKWTCLFFYSLEYKVVIAIDQIYMLLFVFFSFNDQWQKQWPKQWPSTNYQKSRGHFRIANRRMEQV